MYSILMLYLILTRSVANVLIFYDVRLFKWDLDYKNLQNQLILSISKKKIK